jgi:hypothetical protein
MSEKRRVGLAVVVVALLIVVVSGLVSLALLAFVGLARDTFTWDYATVRLIVIPFALLVVYGVRVFPPALAARARSQGRDRDAESIESATKIVYLVFGVLLLAAVVFVLLQQFSAREVFKILVLPPVLVGGILVAWMHADMAGGRKGWTLALAALAATGGLTWLIAQL